MKSVTTPEDAISHFIKNPGLSIKAQAGGEVAVCLSHEDSAEFFERIFKTHGIADSRKTKEVDVETYVRMISTFERGKIRYNVFTESEIPIGTHSDFTTGEKWPEAAIGYVIMNESRRGHPDYKGEKNKYFIYDKN